MPQHPPTSISARRAGWSYSGRPGRGGMGSWTNGQTQVVVGLGLTISLLAGSELPITGSTQAEA